MAQWTEGLTLGLQENAEAAEDARVASITAKVAAARAAIDAIGPQTDPAIVATLRALTEALGSPAEISIPFVRHSWGWGRVSLAGGVRWS